MTTTDWVLAVVFVVCVVAAADIIINGRWR